VAVTEEEVPEEELPKCPDHQPSSFLKGKPRSILSLLLLKANGYICSMIIVALSHRSWLITLAAYYTFLVQILYLESLFRIMIEYCLALLRSVKSGDFLSPAW
jgi:hypothetical protein